MSGPDKLSIIVHSGVFDKVHYALAMAAAAAATNRAATLFFTMEAITALKGRGDQAGWRAMATTGGGRGADRDRDFADNGIGAFEDLLDACETMGVAIMVCEMGLKAIGLRRDDLRGDIAIKEGGIVTFLNDAEKTGQILFI